jgi:hypothetical protein
MLALTGCEDGDLYKVFAPDWISSKADSIAASKVPVELEGMMEDVYTIGATDYSTGWWAAFSKYYQIPDGQVWNAEFNLNINPSATNTYKNFALIICNDEDRGAANYKEYGAIRFDHQPASNGGNSEWGDHINRDNVESTLTFSSDTDEGVDKLGGKVTLTIDRSDANNFIVRMTNGVVTKTYTHKSALTNLNADPANTTIRAFLVPEGSYIGFLTTNIEPIGGCTSAEDKLPLSMKLNGVPRKVLQGTEMSEAFANISATVEFEQSVTKTIPAAELTLQAVPDMYTLGTKTLVAVYNKSYKGENCSAVVASAQFEVVDKMYTSIGATDNSTAFWGAHSEAVRVVPGETVVTTFTNYTNGKGNWNNFVIVLSSQDGSTEYGVLRADNWGWGTGWAGEELASKCMPSGGQLDWNSWLAAMDGAKVTTYITNNGDGTADVRCVMLGNDGQTYTQDYIGLNTVTNPDDFYFHFTVDGCHLEFDDVLGAEDNTTAFWGAHSEAFQVMPGQTLTRRFKNFTNGAGNWNNFIIVLASQDGSTEYGVLRADNWGWGTGWAGEELASKCMPSGGQLDWSSWLAAMDEATVTVSVTNNGNGTADVRCVMQGNDGLTYTQDYIGLNTVTDPNDLYFHFTVDNCHLIFE